jgi:PHD/YefM family antitoxin component YafN of YafNO toxin-antitoxin module
MEKRLEIPDLPDDVRQLVAECELTGKRTFFERAGRVVAILTSYDEYLALRETIDILNDAALRQTLETAEEQVRGGAMLLAEDILVE